MPRLPRVHLRDVAYFVSLDGPQNEPIFKDSADYKKYAQILSQYKQEFGFRLFAYVLLPSRLELLIEASEEHPISQIMQKITPSYTKYYNSRYQRKGSLFQKRFRSVILEKETFLLPLTRFVHAAPSRFHTSEIPSQLPYTSLDAYINKSPTSAKGVSIEISPEVTEVKSMLAQVAHMDSYEQYMEVFDKNELALLEKKLSRATVLGSEQFIAEVRSRIKDYAHKEIVHSEIASGSSILEVALNASRTLPILGAVAGIGLFALVSTAVISPRFFNENKGDNASETQADASAQTAPPAALQSLEAADVSKSTVTKTFQPEAGDLNGTIWEVELVSVSPEGVETPIKDKIKFVDRSFESYYFSSRGFSQSVYSVTVHENGVITWETMQSNGRGETISWRGDWQGKRMEGVLSYHPAGRSPQDFSFMSRLGGQNG